MKTVYILGAGFSMDAGVPSQERLIENAINLTTTLNSKAEEKKKVAIEFLKNQLRVADCEHHTVALEDVFTPLDRCLSENAQFRGLDTAKMHDVREAFIYLIGKVIEASLGSSTHSSRYIELFAKHLIDKSIKRIDDEVDRVSVISTNWDLLLDNEIYRNIQLEQERGVVDYCCYISSLGENDATVKPGLEVLGGGGFNVKLLKLHGSLNWLQCPRCMRLYTGFGAKFAVGDLVYECRHCDSNFPEAKHNHALTSNLIVPTYIKDLSNPQYKIIWQNAGIEVSEASKLVFIGYSLPSADFEMRQLLSRMMRKDAKIHVVNFEGDGDTNKRDEFKKPWKAFFGSREVTFEFDGAKSYIHSIVL